jgi:hypothetical protein
VIVGAAYPTAPSGANSREGHTPGIDEYRHRQADDRTYDIVTVRDGRIIGLHACRDRSEARSLAGIS